jgi:hypothetical protein
MGEKLHRLKTTAPTGVAQVRILRGASAVAGVAVAPTNSKEDLMTHKRKIEQLRSRASATARRMAIMSKLNEKQLASYPRLGWGKRIWWQIQKMLSA